MLPRHVTGFAVALLSLPYLALAGLYDNCLTTSQIPWLNTANDPWDWALPPRVAVWFTKKDTDTPARLPLEYLVDTGSCGIITTKDDVKFDEVTEKIPANLGYQWLSSSEILYTGYWVWRWVWFNHDPANQFKEVKSYVQVLAIEKKFTKCSHWDESQGAACAGSTEEADPTTQLMGISWGRMYDGQPHGNPTRNPLLQVKSVATGRLDKFCPGWVIDSLGINLGLDNSRWPPTGPGGEKAASVEVTLGTDPGADPSAPPPVEPYHYPWSEIPGCVQVQNPADTTPEPCVEASILLDSGMKNDHASIRLPQSNVNTLSRTGLQINPGHIVTVKVGNRGRTLTQIETYTNDDTPFFACDITPKFSNVYADDPMYHSPARFPFANVGRHTYRRWNTGFDPSRGVARLDRHGLLHSGVPKKVDPACSGACGTCVCRTCT